MRGAAFDAQHLHFEIFDEVVLAFRDEFLVKSDRLVGFGIHEVIPLMVGVAELQLLPVHIDGVHLFRRGKSDIGGLAGADVADDALHERTEVTGSAMLDVEDDGRISIVADCHAFAEVVCCCHERRSLIAQVIPLGKTGIETQISA